MNGIRYTSIWFHADRLSMRRCEEDEITKRRGASGREHTFFRGDEIPRHRQLLRPQGMVPMGVSQGNRLSLSQQRFLRCQTSTLSRWQTIDQLPHFQLIHRAVRKQLRITRRPGPIRMNPQAKRKRFVSQRTNVKTHRQRGCGPYHGQRKLPSGRPKRFAGRFDGKCTFDLPRIDLMVD